MCFSAGASFGAAAILGADGAVIISKTKEPSQRMFAAMPLLFALQQVAEGFQWLSFNHHDFIELRTPTMYAFLLFAQVLWPTWLPLSIWRMEPLQHRKKLLTLITAFGLLCSALLGYRLIYFPITSDIEGHHIHYDITSPQWMSTLSSILYCIAILVPAFVSSLKNMKLVGGLLVTSLIVTQIFYREYLISVWCFFAALLSVAILFVVQHAPDRIYVHSVLKNRINPGKAE